MTDAALLVQLVLAAGFLWAGSAKLLPGADTQKTVRDFGVPAELARPVAVLVPIAEIATGFALLFAASARIGAAAACVLLGAFLVGMAVNLILGRTPECKCFGERHTKPVGWRTVARDVVLLAGAAFVFWRESSDPGPGPVARLGEITALEQLSLEQALLILCALLAACILVSLWLVLPRFLRQQGRILLRLDEVERRLAEEWPLSDTGVHLQANGSGRSAAGNGATGLPVGSPFPDFDLLGPSGEEVRLTGLRGRRLVLVNWNSTCPFCQQIAEDLSELDPHLAEHDVDLFLVSQEFADGEPVPATDGEQRTRIWRSSAPLEPFAGVGTPAAYVVDEHGRVASPLEVGAGHVVSLAARAHDTRPHPHYAGPQVVGSGSAALSVGSAAPDFTLTDIHGREVALADFLGRPVLLVFTDPECAACAELLPTVRGLADDRDTDLGVMFVGTGDRDGNRRYAEEQEFPFPLLTDPGLDVAMTYGLSARPSAVLIDSDGALATSVIAGADEIQKLLMGAHEPTGTRR